MTKQFSSLASVLMPITETRRGTIEARGQNNAVPIISAALEATTMAIDTYSSSDEVQEIRSIRSHQSPHLPHGETAEERTLGEIERFRTLALEHLEHSLDSVLKDIVEEVVGREISLAPVDIENIVQRALRQFERQGPVRLRVAPADVLRVQTELPIVADAGLTQGDLVIEVRDGEITSRLAVRLSCAMSRLQNETVTSVHGDVLLPTERKIA
jgi:hypothetical protein